MPEYRVGATFILSPRGHFRFGSHPAALEESAPLPASDTLFSALISAAAALGDGVEDVLAAYRRREPPFLISSAMPHVDRRAPFVPKPQRMRRLPSGEEEALSPTAKAFKRATHVELPLLRWYAGERMEASAWGPLVVAGSAPGASLPWQEETIPGVTVDRVSGASALYSQKVFAFQQGYRSPVLRRAGTEALEIPRVRWAVHVLAVDEAALQQVHRWFAALSYLGLGGRRSRGSGTFDIAVEELQLSVTPAPRGMALSWVAPRDDELRRGLVHPDRERGYRVDERFGWSSSPWWLSERSRRVLMVAEGSYLSPELPPPVGQLVDLTPGASNGRHPLYRYGFGLFLDEEALG